MSETAAESAAWRVVLREVEDRNSPRFGCSQIIDANCCMPLFPCLPSLDILQKQFRSPHFTFPQFPID